MVCLTGKSKTPHRWNTFFSWSSLQLPCLSLGPLKICTLRGPSTLHCTLPPELQRYIQAHRQLYRARRKDLRAPPRTTAANLDCVFVKSALTSSIRKLGELGPPLAYLPAQSPRNRLITCSSGLVVNLISFCSHFVK